MRKPARIAAVATALAISPLCAAHAAPVRIAYHDSFAKRAPGTTPARSFGDAFTYGADLQA